MHFLKSPQLSKIIYSIYDSVLLKIACPIVWKCNTKDILKLYNKNISPNHLDIGCGTGYFIKNCKQLPKNLRLMVMDINKKSMEISKKELANYNPTVIQHNILNPLPKDIPKFDSIGANFLMHCLPGKNMRSKNIAFKNIAEKLNPNGVFFGSTFIIKDHKLNIITKIWTNLFNKIGLLNNKQDTIQDLEKNLKQHFKKTHIEIKGHCAMFVGKK